MTETLKRAIETVKRAVECDNGGKYNAAIKLYTDSLDIFLAALKGEKNEERKDLIRLKMKEYLDRAEELKRIIASGGTPTPLPTAAPKHQPQQQQQQQQQQQSVSGVSHVAASGTTVKKEMTYYGALIRQAMHVNEILEDCHKRRCKFVDALFPSNVSSLFKGAPPTAEAADVARTAVWRRLGDVPGAVLCQARASPQDVIQGVLGDCWFLGALSLVAGKPEKITEVIPYHSVEYGLFVVRFFRNRARVDVVVDDMIPCTSNGTPVFARNRWGNELWVPIVEKAYAKMCGSYYSMESGNESDALVDLTGGIAFMLALNEPPIPPPDMLVQLLKSYHERGFLMGCANNKPSEVMGIVPSHAYGILGVHTVPTTAGTTVTLLHIRNPWGEREWMGPWCDGSPQWRTVTAQVQRAIGYSDNSDDGSFFMAPNDFLQHYEKVYLCKTVPQSWAQSSIKGAWELGRSAGGCNNQPTWLWNPQYTLTVRQKTQAFIVLTQGDIRKFGDGNGGGYTNSIGMVIVSRCRGGLRVLSVEDSNVAERTSYANTRERAAAILLDPEQCPYIIVPATFDPGKAARFRLGVFAEASAAPTLGPVSEWPCVREVRGSWTAQCSGGCSNNKSWKSNPRFSLRVADPSSCGDVSLRLSTIAASQDLERAPAVGIYLLDESGNGVVASSKSFSQHSLLRVSVPPGNPQPFVILVATFNPGFVGDFILSAFGLTPSLDLRPI